MFLQAFKLGLRLRCDSKASPTLNGGKEVRVNGLPAQSGKRLNKGLAKNRAGIICGCRRNIW